MAIVYLVMQTDVGRFEKFIVSKTRVAPIQNQTILRLELLSVLHLARLVFSVSDCLAHQPLLAPMNSSLIQELLYSGFRVTKRKQLV